MGEVETECLRAIAEARSAAELVEVDNKFLSKKGALSELLKALRDVSAADRPKVGARANEAKTKLEAALVAKRDGFENEALASRLEKERVDFTLPARRAPVGSLHPVTKITAEIVAIFRRLGFELAEGPEIETEFNNFDALNMREDHPARDMQDTFYVQSEKGGRLLRTHTSPVQIRSMLAKKKPPVRILCPGAVFRSDYDMTHSPMFHQVEGLYVDRDVSFAELRGALLFFAREMFGAQTQIRLRPSYFPFVEPGAEVDVTCVLCKGKGCRVCKDTGWLEILGGGMVHPKVFEAVGYGTGENPEPVTGFAFGMGVERIAMLKYGVPDLRLLFENDVRFLKQFGV
ncbi:MAG: phenylalanine--tRNA ligase subunit alpha [Deltaproteobacteria bacterium]|nr:phenylalanine--tRNA ligase subunit alpha [Deltaproteobacteria bacterium]